MKGIGYSNLEAKFYLVYLGHFSAEEIDNMEMFEFDYYVNKLVKVLKK